MSCRLFAMVAGYEFGALCCTSADAGKVVGGPGSALSANPGGHVSQQNFFDQAKKKLIGDTRTNNVQVSRRSILKRFLDIVALRGPPPPPPAQLFKLLFHHMICGRQCPYLLHGILNYESIWIHHCYSFLHLQNGILFLPRKPFRRRPAARVGICRQALVRVLVEWNGRMPTEMRLDGPLGTEQSRTENTLVFRYGRYLLHLVRQ